jgi:hypothetical protein
MLFSAPSACTSSPRPSLLCPLPTQETGTEIRDGLDHIHGPAAAAQCVYLSRLYPCPMIMGDEVERADICLPQRPAKASFMVSSDSRAGSF